jgi:hypothetical protein
MNVRLATGLVLSLLLVAQTARAHHSVAGQFDMTRTVTLKGVISQVEWVNPHIYINLDVKQPDGKIATWRLECVPVAMARKAGLSKTMLAGNGETVTVDAFPARDGTKQLGFMVKLTYPDGHFYQFSAETRKAAS